MIEWSHFSMMQGRVKIDPSFLIWALTYRTSRLEKMDWIWSVQCSRFKMSCWSSYMYTPLFLYEFAQWQGSYRSEMNTTRIKLPINVYFKCLRIKTGFTLNVEINFSEARKFFQLSLFRIFFVILQLGCCWKMIVMIYKIKLTYYLGVCCILADFFFNLFIMFEGSNTQFWNCESEL